MENFDLRKYLAENRLLKEEKTFNVYNDGGEPVLVNLDKATPSQEKLIRWEMPNITEPETSEEAQEIANEIMQLNSVEDVKQYYGYKRGWFNSSLKTLVGDAMVVYSNLAENKLLKEEVDISKISKLGDYNETEDSYKYKDHFVQKYIDGGKTIYAVFKDRGEKTDSYGSPDFEASDLKKVEDFLTENKLLKEEVKVGDTIGNTVQGFDFEVIGIEGDKYHVKHKRSGKEFKTDKDNMYKPI